VSKSCRSVRLLRLRAAALGCAISLLVLLAASCGGDGEEEPPLPSSPTVLDITMREYRYEHRGMVPSGRVVFRAHNKGRKPHEIVLVALPENFPPIDKQLHSNKRRPLVTLAYGRRLRPGESDAFAADLTPGRYAMLDFASDRPGGETYAQRGMNSELRAR